MAENLIALGASAGGVAALQTVVASLPADLRAAVLVVLHIPVHTPTSLHDVLRRDAALAVKLAEEREHIRDGVVYIAPTDRHLVVEGTYVRLTRGPRENRVRPCIDVLFRSSALHFGPRVIGVVLTGALDDGTAGLWSIKDRGGIAIVQDSEVPFMPPKRAGACDGRSRVATCRDRSNDSGTRPKRLAATTCQIARTGKHADRDRDRDRRRCAATGSPEHGRNVS
jgi:chemotaxis response regulator CheB